MSSLSDADQLANHLDRVLPPHGQVVPESTGEEPAVVMALRLARGPHPVLDAAGVARIGAQLLAAVDSQPARPRVAFRPALGVLRWAAAACLVLVVAIIGTATASARSLPGDTLYPVKRLVEQGQLALTSDGGEVALRLDLAGRRLDEFETLLRRGEVRPEALDDAADQMNSTLALVEDGAGTPEKVAHQLIDLSTRQVQLAEEASTHVTGDPAKAIRLHEAVSEAAAVEQAARQLIAPPDKPTVRAIPDRFAVRSAPQNLSRDTAVFIPHDSSPGVATVDAPTAVFVEQTAPPSPPGAPVVYRPPVEPTSTPPAIDPGTATPDDRSVAGDGFVVDAPTDRPADDLITSTPDLPPTDPPGTPADDRSVAGEGSMPDTPTALPGEDLTTPTPAPPGPTPDTPTAGEEIFPTEGDLATPFPDLLPTEEASTLPAGVPEALSEEVSPTPAVDLPATEAPATPVPVDSGPALEATPAVEPPSPPPDVPPVMSPDQPSVAAGNGPPVDLPAVAPQADLSIPGESAPVLPGDPPPGDALTGEANGS